MNIQAGGTVSFGERDEEPSGDVKLSLPTRTAILLAAAAATISTALAVVIAYVAFYDATFWDFWVFIDGQRLLDNLFTERLNEHPFIPGRVVFWIDHHLFDARGRLPQLVTILLMISHIPCLVWLAARAGIQRPVLTVAPAATALILGAWGFENLILQVQPAFMASFTFSAWACAFYTRHVETGSRFLLAASLACIAISVSSLGNGAFAPATLAIIALLLRRPASAAVFGVVAALAFVWLFSGSTGAGSFTFSSIPAILHHLVVQLGAPFGGAMGYLYKIGGPVISGLPASTAFGTVIMLVAVMAVLYAVLLRRTKPAILGLAGIIIFCGLSAGATALGRHGFGIEQAMSSRYHAYATLIVLSILVIGVEAAMSATRPVKRTLAALSPFAGLFVLVVAATSIPQQADLSGRYRAALAGRTALVAGAPDPSAIGQLAWDMDMAQKGAAHQLETQTAMFADASARRMESRLTADEMQAGACESSEWQVSTMADTGFRTTTGRMARRAAIANARHVLIAEDSGLIVGYGLVPRRPTDLNPLARDDGRLLDWTGHIRAGAQGPYTAWLADSSNVLCAMGPGQTQTP
jgi:hypothetical protein